MVKIFMNLQISKCAGSPEYPHLVELVRIPSRQMPTQKLPGLDHRILVGNVLGCCAVDFCFHFIQPVRGLWLRAPVKFCCHAQPNVIAATDGLGESR